MNEVFGQDEQDSQDYYRSPSYGCERDIYRIDRARFLELSIAAELIREIRVIRGSFCLRETQASIFRGADAAKGQANGGRYALMNLACKEWKQQARMVRACCETGKNQRRVMRRRRRSRPALRRIKN